MRSLTIACERVQFLRSYACNSKLRYGVLCLQRMSANLEICTIWFCEFADFNIANESVERVTFHVNAFTLMLDFA